MINRSAVTYTGPPFRSMYRALTRITDRIFLPPPPEYGRKYMAYSCEKNEKSCYFSRIFDFPTKSRRPIKIWKFVKTKKKDAHSNFKEIILERNFWIKFFGDVGGIIFIKRVFINDIRSIYPRNIFLENVVLQYHA